MIKVKQFFCPTYRKKRYQMLLRVSVVMSKRGQNCPVSSSRKRVNLKWWKDDSRWKPEQKRAHLTVSTTKLQVMWVDSVGTSRGSSHLEVVSWLSVVPSISVTVQLLKMKKWSSQWTQFMQLHKEAWKNPQLTCSQRQWLHSLVGRASHRYREVTGSNLVEVLNFFQASLRNWPLQKIP